MLVNKDDSHLLDLLTHVQVGAPCLHVFRVGSDDFFYYHSHSQEDALAACHTEMANRGFDRVPVIAVLPNSRLLASLLSELYEKNKEYTQG